MKNSQVTHPEQWKIFGFFPKKYFITKFSNQNSTINWLVVQTVFLLSFHYIHRVHRFGRRHMAKTKNSSRRITEKFCCLFGTRFSLYFHQGLGLGRSSSIVVVLVVDSWSTYWNLSCIPYCLPSLWLEFACLGASACSIRG